MVEEKWNNSGFLKRREKNQVRSSDVLNSSGVSDDDSSPYGRFTSITRDNHTGGPRVRKKTYSDLSDWNTLWLVKQTNKH